ncbi:MAG: TolC family protein, partial [Muribaculaceae bacterium]|nr:TolC family protein [Muribaculaceae bacterium]
DLAMALRRIEVSRLSMKSAQAGYYPKVGVSAGWTKERSSGLLNGPNGRGRNSSYFDIGASLSWEIDLFGRINSQVKEKKAELRATRAEAEGVRLSVAAEIATQYIQIRTWQAELAIARNHIARQEKVVKITEARKEAGLGSGLEVAQAKVVYYSTQASIPILENSIATGINSLSVLVGEFPPAVKASLTDDYQLPSYLHIIDPGTPRDLLRRRPDIIQASEELSAQVEAVGIAKKDFLPTLTINGQIGTGAHRMNDLFHSQSLTYSIEPTISWTIFDGFSRKYNVAIARQQLESQVENYNLTALTAVEEVENALSSYQASVEHIKTIEQVIVQADKSLEFSVDLYKRGLNPFTDVVSAQLNCLEYQEEAVEAKGQALNYLITLYKALGGGWQ